MKTLILGTANFGNAYGVANKGTIKSSMEAKELVSWAQSNGINNFDTAMAYGDAEAILGNSLNLSLRPNVDTKLDLDSCTSREQIVKGAMDSCKRLKVDQLGTIYLHNDQLMGSSNQTEIVNGLKDVLDLGVARQIGVSVYEQSAIFSCKKVLPELQVFQVPENICDRRLFFSKELLDLSAAGNTFVVRSVFLQGLLLMHPESIPDKLSPAKDFVSALNQFCLERSFSVLNLCLSYVESIAWSDRYIVGVTSIDQLNAITTASLSLPEDFERYLQVLPEEIVDPRKWQL
jgi:aryl-alcohol dehydrogenase-like predicted oxidoreductase